MMQAHYHGKTGDAMPCSQCGAKRGHLRGCPTQEKAAKKGHGKGLLKGERAHTCRTCDGNGTITEHFKVKGKWQTREKTCPNCKGSGRIDE